MGTEVYRGIKGVDTSTSMFIDNPRRALEATNAVNRGKAPEEWMRIEMYAIRPNILDLVSDALKDPKYPPIPKGVTVEKIRKWQEEEFPNTYIERIHLPFGYNTADLWVRALGDLKHPRHFLWMEAMGAATNGYAIRLAKDLQDLQDKPVGISAHTNIIEGFAQEGKLSDIKNEVAFVLAESTVRSKTSVEMNQIDLYDPVAVAQLTKKYKLDGMVFGLDHAREQGVDIEQTITNGDVRKALHSIHLGERHHDLVAIGNEEFANFFAKAAKTEFHHPVRATLDYDPRKVKRMSYPEQLKLLTDTTAWIMSFQSQ